MSSISNTQKMSCGICYSEKLSSCLCCSKCAFKICSGCLVKYMKTQSDPEPVCPITECRAVFTREIIVSLHSQVVEKAYKEMREKFLLDIEKARLPEAQRYLGLRTTIENFDKDVKPAYLARLKEIHEVQIQLSSEENAIKLELRKHQDVSNAYKNCEYETAYEQMYSFEPEEHYRERYTRTTLCPCPSDGCRGFVISETGKCGVCDTEVCKRCMLQVRGNSHTCDPNDVESAKEIKSQTRPCPKCAIPISKIDGCDQMWCVSCHTPFSWKTGAIVRGAIHNPHFFAYQRERAGGGDIPRVEGDLPENGAEDEDRCGNGQVAAIWGFINAKYMWHPKVEPISDFLIAYRQFAEHFQNEMLPVINERQATAVDCTDLRVKFLLNEITEKEFAAGVQQRDKKRQKELEVDGCILIFFDSANRIYTNFVADHTKVVDDIVEAKRQIENLIVMTNERFEKISQVYKNKVHPIEYCYDPVSRLNVFKFISKEQTNMRTSRKIMILNFDGSRKETTNETATKSKSKSSKSKASSASKAVACAKEPTFSIEDDDEEDD